MVDDDERRRRSTLTAFRNTRTTAGRAGANKREPVRMALFMTPVLPFRTVLPGSWTIHRQTAARNRVAEDRAGTLAVVLYVGNHNDEIYYRFHFVRHRIRFPRGVSYVLLFYYYLYIHVYVDEKVKTNFQIAPILSEQKLR